MTVKTVTKTSVINGKEITIKTYPGLFGDFLDWSNATKQPSAYATIAAYVELMDLDKDQADWLWGIIRRAVNDGKMSDSWWD